MQIRTRLTIQFLLIGGMIMIIASCAIYFSSASYRKESFYSRLENKAMNTAKLLIEIEEIDANLLLKIEKNNPVNLPNEKIIILNYKNDTLYSSDEKGEIKIKREIIDRVRLNEKVSYKQDQFEVLGLLYTERYDRFVVIVAATDTLGFLELKNLGIILIVVCLISFLLFFIAGWFYSGRALKPISDVVRRVEEISITSLNLRVFEGNGTDEIASLAKTFNKMLGRLETSFTVQKDFIANASHELRTPLTSINGQLDVLLMKDRSPSEYKTVLSSVLEDIKSLIDLSNRLLLIARTSAESSENLNCKVRIDEIIWQSQEEMQKFNKEFHVNIYIDSSLTDSDQMIVIGDEYLLKTAFTNIIDNACKYSSDHTVNIMLEHIENWVKILFEDKGIGIPEREIDKIFEPFYRGSNAKSIPGSGIGLQLVNQIIKNHHGIIKFSSEPGAGTKVSILLPSTCG